MSVETLDLLNEDRKNTIELSPFSELFNILGGGTFYGIFDKSHVEDNKDSANVYQKNIKARIMVASLPDGLTGSVTKITRETPDTEYVFSSYGLDEEGLGIVWLY